MSRLKRVAQAGALGLTIAALGAGAIAGKRYAEQKLLANVMGDGTTARGISVHWMRSTGCVEAIETPLASSRDRNEHPLSLYADKLWFVFDNAQLLRKRLVMPRVIAEGVLISPDASAMLDSDVLNVDFDLDAAISMPDIDAQDPLPTLTTSVPTLDAVASVDPTAPPTATIANTPAATGAARSTVADPAQDALTQPASHEWIARLAAIRSELISDRFAKSRQVSIDADMLSERMQLHFENVRQQAIRALNEVRDIQLQIQTLDNVLRHELKIMAQRERIEQLKSSLIALKSEVARGDKALAEELSRLRAALLVEKESLMVSSQEFRAPLAKDLADETIEQMILRAMREPARQAWLMRDLMYIPFTPVVPKRGRDVRYVAGQLPATDIESAKLSGELEWDGQRLPFTASGSFKIPSALSDADELPKLVADTARWQMQIGSGASATQLSGHALTLLDRSDMRHTTQIRVEDPSNWQTVDFEFRSNELSGHGQVSLRPWISKQTESFTYRPAYRSDPSGAAASSINSSFVEQWISYALSDVEDAPESLSFRFTANDDSQTTAANEPQAVVQQLSLDNAELMMTESASMWLGQRIAKAATTEIADLTTAAASTLEAHISQRIVELQRSVALMRNDADQHLNAQLDELKKIQAAINANLQQRAGTHFARLRSEEVIR